MVSNLCQGSTGAGFVRHYEKCARRTESVYSKNTVGSANIGFLLFGGNDGLCAIAQNLMAYACKVAVLGFSRAGQLRYENVVAIDSALGIGLRIANKGIDQTAYIKNSYIASM